MSPTDEEIRQLEQIVLDSVAGGRPLPGTDGVVELPDIVFIRRQPEILIEEDGLAGKLSGDSLPQPLKIVSPADLRAAARESDVAVLKFGHEFLPPDAVRITAETRLVSSAPNRGDAGLGAVHVVFRKRNGRWEAEGEPTMLAM